MLQKEMLSCTAIALLIAILTDNGKQRENLLQAVEKHQQPSCLPIMSTIKSLL